MPERPAARLVLILLLSALWGCDGPGSDPPSPTTDAPEADAASTQEILVTPSLGKVVGAGAQAFDAAGGALSDEIDTGDDGRATLQIPEDHTGPVVVTLVGKNGAVYFDEATGEDEDFPRGESFRAALPAPRPQVGVSILTELALRLAEASGGDLDATAIELANERVRAALAPEIADLLTPPTIVDAQTSTSDLDDDDGGRLAARLGGLVRLAEADTTPALTLLRQLSLDAADGNIDGLDGSGNTIVTVYRPASFAGDFVSAVQAFAGRFGTAALESSAASAQASAILVPGSGSGSGAGAGAGNGGGNQSPTADAGTDQVASIGDVVTLNGSGTDADGTIEAFAWTQVAGPTATLSDATSAAPTFTAPTADTDTILTFLLRVSDDAGATDVDLVDVVVGPAVIGQALLGPIVGARVEIFDATNPVGTALIVRTTEDSATLEEAGRFRIPASLLAAGTLYVVRVTGGQDVDADDDGIRDAVPTDFEGTIRAMGTREDLIAGVFRVNALTEVAYQGVVDLLVDGAPQADIVAGLDLAARRQLARDLNGDGNLNVRDLLAFRPREDVGAYARGAAALRTLNETLLDGSASPNQLADQASIVLASLDGFTPDISAVALENDLLLAVDFDGLRVVDVQDRSEPTLLATLEPIGSAFDMAFRNGFAFVAGVGVTIVDVTTPTAPVVVDTLLTGLVDRVELVGDRLYVARGSNGLAIVDVSDPRMPVILSEFTGTLEDDYADVTVAGDLAYVANGTQGLVILDVSDPALPLLLSTTAIDPGQGGGFARDAVGVDVSGTTVYLNASASGLAVFDASNPAMPNQIGALVTFLGARAQLVGDTIYALSDGLLFVDVSDPTLPRITAQIELDGNDLVVDGGTVIVATRLTELLFIDADQSVASSMSVRVQFGQTESVALFGDRLYTADGPDGFAILDVADPTSPRLVARSTGVGNFRSLAVGEGRVYAADDDGGIKIFDTTGDGAPALVGEIPTDTRIDEIEITGTRVYFLLQGDLQIVDASDPANPSVLSITEATSGPRTALTLDGNRLYIDEDIFDISNPGAPVLLGRSLPGDAGVEHAVIDGNIAYFLSDDVFSVDVSDPANAVELGRSDRVGRSGGLVQVGSRLFAAVFNNGIRILDVSDPANPVVQDLLEVIGTNPQDVATDGEFLFIPGVFTGLEIRRIPVRSRGSLPFD